MLSRPSGISEVEEYYKVTGDKLSPIGDPPELSDFCSILRQRKYAELALVTGGMFAVVQA